MKLNFKIALLTIIFALMLSGLSVYGEESTTTLNFDMEEPIVITVMWDIGDIDIAFETPSGTIISPDNLPDGVSIITEELGYKFIVLEPEMGQWIVNYDKKENESFKIFVDPYMVSTEPMWISDFTVGEVYDEKYIDAEFFVDGGGSETKYDYEISIALKDDDVISKSLKTSYGYSDEIETVTLNLSDVNSYDDYVLRLKITYDQKGYELFDMEESEPFSFTSSYNNVQVENFQVILDEEGLGQVIIEPVDNYSIDGYVINVYEDGGLEPIDTILLDDSENMSYINYHPLAESLKVEVMTEDNGVYSKPIVKEINLAEIMATQINFHWPEDNATNQAELIIPYDNGGNEEITITLNNVVNTILLGETGEIKLSLEEGNNDIIIGEISGDEVGYNIEKSIILDTYPPQLFIYEDVNEIITNNDFIMLLGNVEQSALLTCNGQGIEIGDDGEFKYELALKNGSNEVELIATDGVGNSTKYIATISKGQITNDNVKELLPLFIGIIVAISLVLIYAIVGAKKKGGK